MRLRPGQSSQRGTTTTKIELRKLSRYVSWVLLPLTTFSKTRAGRTGERLRMPRLRWGTSENRRTRRWETLSWHSVGFESLCNKLRVDPKVGLTGHDFAERTEKFGNNYREEPVAKSWFSLFIGALDDQMLKLLIVCAVFSITFDMILAEAHERSHGKH